MPPLLPKWLAVPPALLFSSGKLGFPLQEVKYTIRSYAQLCSVYQYLLFFPTFHGVRCVMRRCRAFCPGSCSSILMFPCELLPTHSSTLWQGLTAAFRWCNCVNISLTPFPHSPYPWVAESLWEIGTCVRGLGFPPVLPAYLIWVAAAILPLSVVSGAMRVHMSCYNATPSLVSSGAFLVYTQTSSHSSLQDGWEPIWSPSQRFLLCSPPPLKLCIS